MNKHLAIVVETALKQEGMDFEYATERDSETYFLIFQSWNDREKFIDMCKEYINKPDAMDYQIEKEFECELVFDDEYTTCNDCYHIIRTSPTHYGWQPDFYHGDGFIACKHCFDEQEDYQEAYIQDRINNPKTAINGLITEEQIEDLGFVKFNAEESYENGWYKGQTDDPQQIYDALSEKFEEVIFFISGVGQFDMHFDAFVRHEIIEED